MSVPNSKVVPVIYEENTEKVLDMLRQGEVEYMGSSNWSYQDRFFCFFVRHMLFFKNL